MHFLEIATNKFYPYFDTGDIVLNVITNKGESRFNLVFNGYLNP